MNDCLELPKIAELTKPTGFSRYAEALRLKTEETHSQYVSKSLTAAANYRNQLKAVFESYKNKWLKETRILSDSDEIYGHSSYRSIIELGQDVIPFIIDDLKKTDNHWFYALTMITGQNPIQENHWGDIKRMKQDWLEYLEKLN